MAKFEVDYTMRGRIVVSTETEEKAHEMVLNSDYVSTEELIKGVQQTIEDCGNDAILINDIFCANTTKEAYLVESENTGYYFFKRLDAEAWIKKIEGEGQEDIRFVYALLEIDEYASTYEIINVIEVFMP